MTALEKAESALHRSAYVMDTGAACPPDFRPWPRDLGPLVTHPQSAGHRRCGGHRRGARVRPRRRPQTGDTGHGVPSRRRVAAGDHHGRGTGCAGAGFTSRRDRRPDAGQPRHRVDAPPRGAAHFSVGFDGVVLNNAAASAVGRLFTAGAQPPPDRHHQHRAQRGVGRAAAGPVSGSSRGVDGFTRLDGPRAATPLRDGRSPSRSTPIGGQTSADLLSRCTDR